MTLRLALSLFLLACSPGRVSTYDGRPSGPIASARASALATERIVTFEGTCDASGAVPISSKRFAVADDEDNVLRVYDADKGGPPVYAVDMTAELHLRKEKNPEADLEAATRIGDYALWIGSHARNKKGKIQADRLRFFATSLPADGLLMRLEGVVYTGLLDDLLADARLGRFNLDEAAALSPQAKGGLNLEGMTATPSGGVVLGFRNPVPGNRALLVELTNPLDPMRGRRAQFGEPLLLDLGGLGVRGLSYWRGRYLIAAGHYEHGAVSRLFAWAGDAAAPEAIHTLTLGDFNPEAFFTPEDRDEFMVLSDDGSRTIGGVRCKDLEGAKGKRFRGLWLKDVRPR